MLVQRSSLRLFPSSELEGGSFVFQRDVLRYSTLLREQVGRRKRAAAYGWIDGSEEGCTRINTETWSLELIPEPSKVHLETPAASPPHPSFF